MTSTRANTRQDVFSAAARAFLGGLVRTSLVERLGINVLWLDNDEPGGTDATLALRFNNGTYCVGCPYVLLLRRWFGRAFVLSGHGRTLSCRAGTWPASFVGSMYPMALARTLAENVGSPLVMLGRGAWAGTQRYSRPAEKKHALFGLWDVKSLKKRGRRERERAPSGARTPPPPAHTAKAAVSIRTQRGPRDVCTALIRRVC